MAAKVRRVEKLDYSVLNHVYLSDKNYDRISKMIRNTYPNSCIIEILEVFNSSSMQEKYMQTIEKHPDGEIFELFHGTSKDGINNIIANGFLVEKNVLSAFGKGTYFSNSASVSYRYAALKKHINDLSYVLISDVLLTSVVSGAGFTKTTKGIPMWKDNALCYFCVPYDYCGLPKYVVAFHQDV